MRSAVPVSVCASLLLSAGSASAAVLEDTGSDTSEGQSVGYGYTAAPGERNRLRISATRSRRVIFDDAGAGRLVVRAPFCKPVSRRRAVCQRIDAGLAANGLFVDLRDGRDVVAIDRAASRRIPDVEVLGGRGADTISVRSANRELQVKLYGGSGDDRIFFAGGLSGGSLYYRHYNAPFDEIHGGAGDDRLVKRSGAPLALYAGSGRDVVDSRSGRRDVVDCGPGRDRVMRDRSDRVLVCEGAHPR